MSFHASSRLIQVNLLHAAVSYIIDIACHWSFFSILPVLATFWIAKTLIFFHFPTPNFAEPYPSNLRSPMSRLDYCAKTRNQPILWHCLGAVLQYLVIFPKSGLKTAKFQQNQRCFRSRTWETNASQVRMWFARMHHDLMIHEYLMSSKTGNSTQDFRRLILARGNEISFFTIQ